MAFRHALADPQQEIIDALAGVFFGYRHQLDLWRRGRLPELGRHFSRLPRKSR
jgi:hypothetical protein